MHSQHNIRDAQHVVLLADAALAGRGEKRFALSWSLMDLDERLSFFAKMR
jgi:hypothetical protein